MYNLEKETLENLNSYQRAVLYLTIKLQANRYYYKPQLFLSLVRLINRPLAGSGHMVRKILHWDANDAVGLSKQWNYYQSSVTFLCFESPDGSFASQCNLFRTT